MFKTRLVLVSSLCFVLCLALISSCTEPPFEYNVTTYYQPCDSVFCLNGGSCYDGNCICPDGYEGTTCETKWNEKFIGNYRSYDNCYTASDYYDCSINAVVQTPDQLILYNIGTFCPNVPLQATVTPEKTSFHIPWQNPCGDTWISGNANMNNNSLSISLHARDTVMHSSTHCSMVLDKQ